MPMAGRLTISHEYGTVTVQADQECRKTVLKPPVGFFRAKIVRH